MYESRKSCGREAAAAPRGGLPFYDIIIARTLGRAEDR